MRNFFIKTLVLLPVFIIAMACHKNSTSEYLLFSPDSLVEVRCTVVDSLDGAFQYAVFFNHKPILLPSGIEIDPANASPFKDHFRVIKAGTITRDETWDRVWGKRKQVKNQYHELKMELQENVKLKRKINLYFRAYNDGVALRYEIPVQKGLDSLVLANEKIAFRFNSDHTIWAAFWNKFHLSQEVEFTKSNISDVKKENIIGTPLLIKSGDSAWVSLLEANVTDWYCSGLTAGDEKNMLVSRPSWLPHDTTIVLRTKNQRLSPWKVIMIADQPGKLVESDIVQNLNEPCALKDVSWIKPGVSAWDWWWSGRYAPKAGFALGPNTATMKYYIDFAAEMGWQYQLVDWGWYGESFNKDGSFKMDADITKMTQDIDIPGLVQYAAKKDIKLVLWLLWANVDKQMEEAFALYEKWGVAGVKIDFMDRNDQEMVNFYHRVADCAARHHLVVDFHGAYVPDGFSRTYPNLITREGILGNEYNKWSDRVKPVHCLTIPFTRLLAGEMDFTPGGFLNDQPAQFKIVGGDSPAPHVMGTRCFQLAMMVVYESAFEVFCESPDNVRNQPGSDFLKGIPSSWDETKVLAGMPGEYIITARKSRDKWYIGGMTVEKRTVRIPMTFLDEGKYDVTQWMDAQDADKNPRKVMKKESTLDNHGTLEIEMGENGGFVCIMKNEK